MKIIKRIGFLLGMAVLGALLFYAYAVTADTGYLIRWERWGGLSEGGIKILAPNVVVTTSGRIYQHIPFCKDNCWQEVERPTNNSIHSLPLKECGWMPDASHYVQSMITCEPYGPGGTATRILAIDQKGDIYSWEHLKSEGGIILIMIAPYLGAFLGFVIGIIILVVYWVINRPQQRRVEDQQNILERKAAQQSVHRTSGGLRFLRLIQARNLVPFRELVLSTRR